MDTNEQKDSSNTKVAPERKLSVPGAIVVAGIIIAIAIIYTRGTPAQVATGTQDAAAAARQNQIDLADNVAAVSSTDHLLGNPEAGVKVVEFTDLQCPFCMRFHPTMKQVMDTYGKEGKVAWIYRHFPLSFHPLAMPGAVAAECVAEQKGNIGFWNYVDAIFSAGLSDEAMLTSIAKEQGYDMAKFSACVKSNPRSEKIASDTQDGLNAGVSGTPYSIVISKSGKKYPINGALDYASVKSIIDLALKDN